jgi:hypothetical protein
MVCIGSSFDRSRRGNMPCEADQRSRLCVTGSSPEAWQRVGAW